MTATLFGPKAACSTNTLPTWHNATEWNATEPFCYGEWRKFQVPADDSPDLKRRSESKYSPDGTEATARAACGQVTRFTGWVIPKLGAAGTGPRQWHCLAQLIGPNYDGTYAGGASVALTVRDGRWRLEQGGLDWWHDLGPYVDGLSWFVDLTVELSELATATITLTLSGNGTSNTWTFQHATWWHQYLVWSHGLYRGSGNDPYPVGPQPTYAQEVSWKLLSLANTWPLP